MKKEGRGFDNLYLLAFLEQHYVFQLKHNTMPLTHFCLHNQIDLSLFMLVYVLSNL